MKILNFIAVFLLAGACTISNATVIFSDDFDAEGGAAGISTLNYNSFSNWTVSGGTVDIVATANPWGIKCAGDTGKCIDMDGSTGNAGMLTSDPFSLSAGDYLLSFDVSGNQRQGSDTMLLQLNGFLSDSISLANNAPWQTVNYAFSVGAATSDSIIFNHSGGDNIGIMLDNVKVSTVPEPASFALLGLSLLGFAAMRRKQK